MEVELLGSPSLLAEDGRRGKVAGRQRALLALLALRAPRPVSADQLVDALWGDDLPADPANALQQRISSLRKEVDPARHGDVLVAAAGGYALRVDDDRIDARRFARRAAEGGRLLAAGDARGALDELTAALELWQGEALDGFADEPWARAEAQRLTELRLAAIEDRYDAALALGSGAEVVGGLAEVVGGLAELVTQHPLRERPAGQLMLALYRAGRQADALEVYDRTRRQLADELGVDPGPALQAIYRRVLDQDAGLQTPAAAATPSTRVDNLPAATQGLVGRDDVLDEFDELLTRGRVVTVTGPGGTGKTTLALEVARRRPRPIHGTWLVELAPLSDADAIAGELATVLGVGSAGLGAASVDAAELAGALRDRHLLLVLDNCEHVVEPVADLVARLVAAAPGVAVLATSREPLGVVGEHVCPLPALGLPPADETDPAAIVATPAVQLLLERVRQHDPWFDLSAGDAAAVSALVRRLDGLPLAIELAAAQLRVLSLAELLASLDDQLALLSSSVRGVPARQRSLRGALDWSWDLLDADQRTAWATLAVPAARFDQTTAARLLAAAGYQHQPLEALRDLVDRSLLLAERDVAPVRYRMLETVRGYGRVRLAELGSSDRVRTAHAEVVEEALAACHTATEPARFGVDVDGLGAWLDEARAALAWAADAGERERVQRLAGLLGWVWLLRGLTAEGLSWLDRGLGEPDDLDPTTADPQAVLWAAGLRLGGADPAGPRWAAAALEVTPGGAEHVIAGVYAAVHAVHAGRLDEGVAHLDAARVEAEGIGGWPLGFCRLVGAQLGRLTGRLAEVGSDAQAALELLDEPGLEWARAMAIDILIDALDPDTEPDGTDLRAERLAREGLALCSGRRLPELEARLRIQLGRVLHARGEDEQARRQLDDAVRLAAGAGGGVGLGFALLAAGSVARRRGDLELAAGQLGEAADLLQGTGAPFGMAEVTLELALTAVAAGRGAEAVQRAGRALEAAVAIGEPDLLARALDAGAQAVGMVDGPEAAASFLAAADEVRARPETVGLQGRIEELAARLVSGVDRGVTGR
jgi:predicted ATPase/DNA-binding SARP family transcriptional activator